MTSQGKPSRAAGSSPKPGAAKASGHRSRGLLSIDAEQQARLLLFGAVGLVVLVALAVIGVGYYMSVVKPRSRTVLQVDDVKVSYDAMVRRMAYEYFVNVNYQRSTQLLATGTYQAVLDELTEVKRAPAELGITVTDAEFDKKFRARIAAAPDAEQKAVNEAFKIALEASGLTEDEYRRNIMAELIDQKLKEKYQAEAPANLQQAKVQVIQTATEEEANKAIARINAGEDFATVAKEMSTESDVATTNGIHPYAIQGTLNSAYDDYAFSADVGKLSTPLAPKVGTGAFYVVQVVDRSDQPATDSEKSTLASQKVFDWLKKTQDEMQASGALKVDFDTQSQNDALLAVSDKVVPKARATQSAQQRQQISQATAIAALTANPSTAVAVLTVNTGATPAADQSQTTPVVPAQPVAPGSNGQ